MEAEDSQPMRIKVISLIFSGKLGVDWVDVGLEMWMKHCVHRQNDTCCAQLPQLILASFRASNDMCQMCLCYG